jgi:hypothetical protein
MILILIHVRKSLIVINRIITLSRQRNYDNSPYILRAVYLNDKD